MWLKGHMSLNWICYYLLYSGVRMKNLLLGNVALIAVIGLGPTSAFSADIARPVYKAPVLAPPPIYNWSGFYVGVEGGYGWGNSGQTDPGLPASPPPPPPPPIGNGNYTVTGPFVGGTLGYNWQSGPWVLGLEGDFSWADIHGSSNTCGPAIIHSCGTKLESLGTVRGRVGYAVGPTGNWLPYVTGGLAMGEVNAWDSLTPAAGSAFRTGWTIGGGVETAFAPRWTAKLEYLYVDLGSSVLFNVVPTVPETVSFRANIIRAGINYKFWP
jgi:outer membrane immunogenic protein